MPDMTPIGYVFEGYEVRLVGTPNNPEWIAKDVCNILEVKNPADALADFEEDEKSFVLVNTRGGSQRLLALSLKGLKRLICNSRSLKARAIAKALGIEVLATSKEENSLRIVQAAFKHLEPIPQFFVAGYRIDLYFPAQRVAVECDENGHTDRDIPYELQRQQTIELALGCKFVRFNPDEPHFNIGDVIDQIMRTFITLP